jgi:hypothetical protein
MPTPCSLKQDAELLPHPIEGGAHSPIEHVRGGAHPLPHAPQLVGSDIKFTHALPHGSRLARQGPWLLVPLHAATSIMMVMMRNETTLPS